MAFRTDILYLSSLDILFLVFFLPVCDTRLYVIAVVVLASGDTVTIQDTIQPDLAGLLQSKTNLGNESAVLRPCAYPSWASKRGIQ